jgi:subtilisin family serine protease
MKSMRMPARAFAAGCLGRLAGSVLAALLGLAAAAEPGWTALPPGLASKLDPRLLREATEPDGEARSVWISFADKGEANPQDLAMRLARAEAELTPRTLARRTRARVHPLVDYHDLPVEPSYLASLKSAGFSPYGASRWFNGAAVRVDGAALARLAELSFVMRLEPVPLARRAAGFPEEAFVPALERSPAPVRGAGGIDYGNSLDQLQQINLPAVHDSGYVGTGVLICVLDEGFNYVHKHEALRDVSIPAGRQRDFVQGDAGVQDTTSAFGYQHGTWTLGVMAANKPGTYVGAAYGAEFALGRTENGFSETPAEMVFWGMGAEWADSLGADIVSSSLGYFRFDDSADDLTYANLNGRTTVVSRAAEIAASKGILVVNSVGNEGQSGWHYLIAPSDVNGDSLLAVGAVDAAGAVAGFSSYGPSSDGRIKPDLAARGVSNPLVSASGNPNVYTANSGTSFSCPLVAGLAACIMQARPTWTPSDVARALKRTASRAGNPDNRMGYGIANALAALRWDSTTGVPPGVPGFVGLALTGPNPMRSDGALASVRFAIGEAAPGPLTARLRVFDAQGRVVRDLWAGTLTRGEWRTATWDGLGNDGRTLGSGLFFITLDAGGHRSTARLVSLR